MFSQYLRGGGQDDLLELGRVADKYQVDEVKRAVVEEAARHLKLECAKLLTAIERSGLREVEEACRRMALERFEVLTKTEGFMGGDAAVAVGGRQSRLRE